MVISNNEDRHLFFFCIFAGFSTKALSLPCIEYFGASSNWLDVQELSVIQPFSLQNSLDTNFSFEGGFVTEELNKGKAMETIGG